MGMSEGCVGNEGGERYTERALLNDTFTSHQRRVRLIDINGSGTRDIVWGDAYDYRYVDLLGGQRPWLLNRVDSGLGKTTELKYETSVEHMLRAERAEDAWTSKMPISVHVVVKKTERATPMVTGEDLVVGGQPIGSYVTEYQYRDPEYDGRQREFRGFAEGRATTHGDDNSPTSVGHSRFLLGGSPADLELWEDNPNEALKGLQYLTETTDERGATTLTTTHTTYLHRVLIPGLDGRGVQFAFAHSADAVAHDASAPNASAADGARTALLGLPSVLTSSFDPADDGAPGAIGAPSPRMHSRAFVDEFGNAIASKAFGCVEACPRGVDEVITTVSKPGRPIGDVTGWIWRTVGAYVSGTGHSSGGQLVRRGESETDFNVRGLPGETRAHLRGSVDLARAHQPTSRSVDGLITTGPLEYDSFGNVSRAYAPNNRCSDISYDPTYALFPVAENAYTKGCGDGEFSTTAEYDRGLGVVTKVIGIDGQVSTAEYDGFGRITALFASDPNSPSTGAAPSMRISYRLPDATGPPISTVHTSIEDGAHPGGGEFLESWAVVDGFGRTLVTLSEADPSTGDGGEWIASGLANFNKKGGVERSFIEFYYSGAVEDAFSGVPPSPHGTAIYDAFGRGVLACDIDGTVTLKTVHHALSTDLWDAADLPPDELTCPGMTRSSSDVHDPLHVGTYVSQHQDGHGRGVLSVERFHDEGALTERYLRTRFLPTGEPEVMERSTNQSAQKVLRWMRYDSLGRMVLNVEPNTTEGFTSNLQVEDTSTLRAWRYAYTDNGELAGTVDARGCGQNFAYDSVGRLVGEDYIPCEPHHAPYTSPVDEGLEGFEVVYFFDEIPDAAFVEIPETTGDDGATVTFGPPTGFGERLYAGRLVATYDRGATSWANYDGRGRVTASWTRVAAPGTELLAGFVGRYANGWFVTEARYDAADRVVANTTGATRPELMGRPSGYGFRVGDESAVTMRYTRRGTLESAGGSYELYGPLVGQIARHADGRVRSMTYGDLAATTTTNTYDARRRLETTETARPPPAAWVAGSGAYLGNVDPTEPSTFQTVLRRDRFAYDTVGNPLFIGDGRLPSEWPSGAKPVSRFVQYDDLYRVTRVDYEHGNDVQAGSGAQSPTGGMQPLSARVEGTLDVSDGKSTSRPPSVEWSHPARW